MNQDFDIKLNKSDKVYNHYTDIKEVKDACDFLNLNYNRIKDYPSCLQIKLVARAINKLVDDIPFPNFFDSRQEKWYPYHRIIDGGWVFDRSIYYFGGSSGEVGFYKNEESSNYAGKHFIDLYIKNTTEY